MLMNLLRVNGITKLETFVDVVIMDLLIIVLGIIAAFSPWIPKLICFFIAGFIFVYEFAYFHGICEDKKMIKIFFLSWTIFPILFLLGPEGFGAIDLGTSSLLHAIGDLLAKNLCGVYINHLKEAQEKQASINELEKQLSEELKLRQSFEMKDEKKVTATLPNGDQTPIAGSSLNSDKVQRQRVDTMEQKQSWRKPIYQERYIQNSKSFINNATPNFVNFINRLNAVSPPEKERENVITDIENERIDHKRKCISP